MGRFFREFHYFDAGEKRGILLLSLLILVAVLVGWLAPERASQASAVETDSLNRVYQSFANDRRPRRDSSYRRFPSRANEKVALKMRRFNPNTADSMTFRQLGLPGWMTRNILTYRAKGGVFRKPEDFKKIYGLTDEQYRQLLPYLDLPAPAREEPTASLLIEREAEKKVAEPKYSPGTMVDLNRADTAELKKIPGIGSGIARMIVGYRARLGGFCRIEQLGEINLDVEKLRPWFEVDASAISRLPVNKASVDRLRRHPYLNFYQAKVVVEHRKKHGKITSLKSLALYDEFTEADFRRLEPYLLFE